MHGAEHHMALMVVYEHNHWEMPDRARAVARDYLMTYWSSVTRLVVVTRCWSPVFGAVR